MLTWNLVHSEIYVACFHVLTGPEKLRNVHGHVREKEVFHAMLSVRSEEWNYIGVFQSPKYIQDCTLAHSVLFFQLFSSDEDFLHIN